MVPIVQENHNFDLNRHINKNKCLGILKRKQSRQFKSRRYSMQINLYKLMGTKKIILSQSKNAKKMFQRNTLIVIQKDNAISCQRLRLA